MDRICEFQPRRPPACIILERHIGPSFYLRRVTRCMVSSVVRPVSTPVVSTISTKISTNVRHTPSPDLISSSHRLTTLIYSRSRKIQAALWRSVRQYQLGVHPRSGTAYRGIQPWSPIARQGLLRDGRIHWRRGWPRHSSSARRHPNLWARETRPILPGIDVRIVRQSRRDPSE